MGKILKALAVIAVAAAIAYFAPQLGLAALHVLGSTAVAGSLAATVAGAVVATALSLVATVAIQAISAAPADAPSGLRRSVMVRDASGLGWTEQQPPAPVPEVLQPIDCTGLRYRYFWPWQRWSFLRISGDCMDGSDFESARWALVDRLAPIAPGSMFFFDIDDIWTAYRPEMPGLWWRKYVAAGMGKRYLGTEPEWGRIVYECTNPHIVCESGLNHVRFAYAIVAHSPTLLGILRKRRQARG